MFSLDSFEECEASDEDAVIAESGILPSSMPREMLHAIKNNNYDKLFCRTPEPYDTASLHHTALHHTALHYTTPHYTTLHYTALH